ncbi:hypothetical protein C5C17_13795 [Pseudoclavibacter sp. RFBA6]|nr:hypothetical protein C5C17_13795 [Pseudoclavibacter sp. RFBA6]
MLLRESLESYLLLARLVKDLESPANLPFPGCAEEVEARMDFLVEISGREYLVAQAALDGLRSRVLDAVRVGGGFVSIPELGTSGRSALITPATSVLIEPAPEQISVSDADAEPDIVYCDIDPRDFPWLPDLSEL